MTIGAMEMAMAEEMIGDLQVDFRSRMDPLKKKGKPKGKRNWRPCNKMRQVWILIARNDSLKALEEQERIAREAEDRARSKSSKYSDKGDFINGLNRTAGNMNLADRIGRRAGQGFIKDEE
ncbi:hypothetical protein EYC80_001075 [Monilinia laxa]|uniref:Uncharacterized protein n=1 Tax=Monilinia laxa TaxID=61186 RepID=A0A5N6K800_MONLA|nr:hypothetical protein EYC80_001075 [Monilinia laxa]